MFYLCIYCPDGELAKRLDAHVKAKGMKSRSSLVREVLEDFLRVQRYLNALEENQPEE